MKAASLLATTTLGLAGASDTVEIQGFSAVVDRFAALFSQAGGRLRTLQTGKLYLYTLGLFMWVLVVGIFGVLLWF